MDKSFWEQSDNVMPYAWAALGLAITLLSLVVLISVVAVLRIITGVRTAPKKPLAPPNRKALLRMGQPEPQQALGQPLDPNYDWKAPPKVDPKIPSKLTKQTHDAGAPDVGGSVQEWRSPLTKPDATMTHAAGTDSPPFLPSAAFNKIHHKPRNNAFSGEQHPAASIDSKVSKSKLNSNDAMEEMFNPPV
eukprot:Filipodium_phascolosomae@DN1780_c0_g1_i1.p1